MLKTFDGPHPVEGYIEGITSVGGFFASWRTNKIKHHHCNLVRLSHILKSSKNSSPVVLTTAAVSWNSFFDVWYCIRSTNGLSLKWKRSCQNEQPNSDADYIILLLDEDHQKSSTYYRFDLRNRIQGEKNYALLCILYHNAALITYGTRGLHFWTFHFLFQDTIFFMPNYLRNLKASAESPWITKRILSVNSSSPVVSCPITGHGLSTHNISEMETTRIVRN